MKVNLSVKYILVVTISTICTWGCVSPSPAAERSSSQTNIDNEGKLKTINAAKFIDRKLADCGLQKAIDASAVQGGGIVKIPAGTFALRRGLVLKNNVQLVGAGMDKTILTPALKVLRLDVAKASPQDKKIYLKEIPAELGVGSAVSMAHKFPYAYGPPYSPGYVTEVDRKAVTISVEAPYPTRPLTAGAGVLTFGVEMALEKSIKKGDTEIVLKNASQIQAGDELTLGNPDNESMLKHIFVKAVKGNTLTLEEPARVDFEAWPAADKLGDYGTENVPVWALFPMVHGANVTNAAVRNLTVLGHGFDTIRPFISSYTLSGVHFFNAVRVKIERVAVRDWPADGISLQGGDRSLVADCEVTGILHNGFHPGTGLTNTTFERNLSQHNDSGLYFCWNNNGLILRHNKFIDNAYGGITGLGCPGDRNNTIEDNQISRNGGPGIEINGEKNPVISSVIIPSRIILAA